MPKFVITYLGGLTTVVEGEDAVLIHASLGEVVREHRFFEIRHRETSLTPGYVLRFNLDNVLYTEFIP